ncbi:hypothetical protein C1H76_4546 [Elsinoe australis]|uniref:Uncharacterized protein n=1 Tax=Elsinoe australis TaxID=40998 RepID=A0A4U7B7H9_9PEZI|nr:hypothetical protein C1H76_4546 [Elsinoe australis]
MNSHTQHMGNAQQTYDAPHTGQSQGAQHHEQDFAAPNQRHFAPPPTEQQFAPQHNEQQFTPTPNQQHFDGTPTATQGGNLNPHHPTTNTPQYDNQTSFPPPPTEAYNETHAPHDGSHPTSGAHTTTDNTGIHKTHSGGAARSQKAGGAIKGAWGKFHGAGELIRGNVNNFMHNAVGDKAAVERDQAVINKGMNEWNTGKFNARDIEPTTQTSHKETPGGAI